MACSLNLITRMIEEEGTRLLLRKARLGETPQAQAEEAPRPPAESEFLERKSTSNLYRNHTSGVALELVREHHLMKDTFPIPFVCKVSLPI
ncbi:hypothetical protein [Peribacillus phoenicis]|uniref:hypothetical protein n=1 Tax=Peribacillus sp. 1P06PA-2 TaxID=3132295 RepID=UPI0039A4C39B